MDLETKDAVPSSGEMTPSHEDAAATSLALDDKGAPTEGGWRVKLYELTEDGSWKDMGTVFASAEQVRRTIWAGRADGAIPLQALLL